MKRSIIDPNRSYTFSDYFELNIPIDELVAYFGYSRQVQHYTFNKSLVDYSKFSPLKEQLDETMMYVDLTSEAARREILIAPILLSLVRHFKMRMQIEYPVRVSALLKGKLDYFLQRNNNLLIVEAKHEDLTRGFNQLAVELIALDQWLDDDPKPLYGSVTVGNAWQFGILDRLTKQITQDIRLYSIPTELETLLQILIAILEG